VNKARQIDDKKVFLLHAQTLDSIFRKSKRRCGITCITFHDARHTAATWMASKLRLLDLCKAFGWSNPKYAMIYYNPKAKDIADMLNRKQPVYLSDAN
jgi:integrase